MVPKPTLVTTSRHRQERDTSPSLAQERSTGEKQYGFTATARSHGLSQRGKARTASEMWRGFHCKRCRKARLSFVSVGKPTTDRRTSVCGNLVTVLFAPAYHSSSSRLVSSLCTSLHESALCVCCESLVCAVHDWRKCLFLHHFVHSVPSRDWTTLACQS